MSRITLKDVTFAFGANVVVDEVSLELHPGWTGITGPNGAGKSTLLRLVAGELVPEHGRISVPGRIARLPQIIDAPRDLSPGERRVLALEALLIDPPEVLLLDEPEGHLDARARARLVSAMRRLQHTGLIGLIVAHDRALLDATCTATVEVAHGRARHFPGPYSAARAAWDAAHAHAVTQRAQLRRERDQAAHALDQARRAAAAADRDKSTARRMKSRHDSDARAIGATTLADWASQAHAKGAARRRNALDNLDRALADHHVDKRHEVAALDFVPRPSPQRILMGGVAHAGETLWFERTQRTHVAGPNGAGKTTLIQALLATATAPEHLFVMPQELDDAQVQASLDALRAAPPDARGKVLQLVAALGADPARLLASASPSPGEARKLFLAQGLVRGVSALVLDEPTNHLDLPSVERLEAALVAWSGALLIATHDARLAAAVTTSTWTLTREGARVPRPRPR